MISLLAVIFLVLAPIDVLGVIRGHECKKYLPACVPSSTVRKSSFFKERLGDARRAYVLSRIVKLGRARTSLVRKAVAELLRSPLPTVQGVQPESPFEFERFEFTPVELT